MNLVEPHPLDYDWRYTEETVDELLEFGVSTERCLCIGAPSIARRLQSIGRDVVLVDRQPIQGVKNQLRIDPSYEDPPASKFDLIFVDPPWYPEILHRWIGWASAVAAPHATIVSSLWPISTRPSAADEHAQLFDWLGGWTDVHLAHATLSYETPAFEAEATALPIERLAGSRRGDRLELHPFTAAELPPPLPTKERWHRFVFDQYQMALRERPADSRALRISPHPLARGWTWTSVSRRAPERQAIDLWSSHNEVAIVEGGIALGRLLPMLRDWKTARQLFEADPALQPLLQWHLATLKFHRTTTWTHLA